MSADQEKPNPDRLEGLPHPRESRILFGHKQADSLFMEALQINKLHHAWLLLGPAGVGKATLAYRFAKLVLSRREATKAIPGEPFDIDHERKDMQMITADNHPNLLVLRRSWNVKTKKYRAQISVDDVRELHHFFGNTAGMGKWRVVIVDKADDLNINAANALLKMLEEPPAFCLFLLISSEPGKLPTTIISRCHKLRLHGLDDDTLKAAMSEIAQHSEISLPNNEQMPIILKLAKGSVRHALEFAGGRTLEDYREIEHILDLLPRMDPQNTVALADRLAARANEQDYHNFLFLLTTQISNRIRQIVIKGEGDKQALAQWSELWETITTKKSEVDLLNLDRGNFILDIFANIEDMARKVGGLKI